MFHFSNNIVIFNIVHTKHFSAEYWKKSRCQNWTRHAAYTFRIIYDGIPINCTQAVSYITFSAIKFSLLNFSTTHVLSICIFCLSTLIDRKFDCFFFLSWRFYPLRWKNGIDRLSKRIGIERSSMTHKRTNFVACSNFRIGVIDNRCIVKSSESWSTIVYLSPLTLSNSISFHRMTCYVSKILYSLGQFS